MSKSPITTHILDTSRGCPASGIEVKLERQVSVQDSKPQWKTLGTAVSNSDGRVAQFSTSGSGSEEWSIEKGIYRLNFGVGAYFRKLDVQSFFPEVWLYFEVTKEGEHYHVPLLLNPFGYTTYRGS